LGGGEAKEILQVSLLLEFYQWLVRERTGFAHRANLKGMLHKESHVKSDDLFFEEIPTYGKMPIISAHFQAKKYVPRSPLRLNHP